MDRRSRLRLVGCSSCQVTCDVMLPSSIPSLENVVNFGSVIGEGTFSTVYNGEFHSSYASEAAPKRLAIKCITRIIEPQVLENELRCLTLLEGKKNVIRLLFAVRHKDCLSLVMPYFEHEKFCRLVRRFKPSDVRDYMRQLLLALSHIHKHNIIHRDIKPNNFLYSTKSNKCALVDFGLAQVIPSHQSQEEKSIYTNETRIPLEDITINSTNTSTRSSLRDKAKGRSSENTSRVTCNCHGHATVCRLCVGTPAINAARAGTAGFRPPEVLMKCKVQTTAVDMWACGVILLSILSGRSNFFNAPDDLTNLVQLVLLFGREPVCEAAMAMGKNLLVEIPGDMKGKKLKDVCKELRQSNRSRGMKSSKREVIKFSDSAYDLLEKLLALVPTDRITALDALNHPFIDDSTST
ncbi:uncharacterized protein [Watersipora subatra]|uniref:uncharacterized protein n=1 Tax=Watersipora subatra TaxID=2589382 RepID=UPI00355B6D71